ACAQVNAQVQAADAHLSQAASLLARANGEANATVSLSQVLTQVAQARSEVNATQSYLVTIASYSYAQRADAYVSAYIRSLSSEANATIQAEQSAYANLTSFQAQYAAYARLQGSAAANVASSASILAAAISKVDGYSGNVSSSISAAQSTESQLHADLQALPGLSVIAAQPGIVADIQACMSDGASYNASLSALQAELNGFSKVQLPSYGSYLGAVNSDGSSARSNGSAYVSSYDKVVSDLQPFLSLPQVQAVLGLSVSATVGAAASSMSQQAAQMTSGGTDASRFSSSVTTAQSDVPVSGALLSMAASAAAQSSVYLNATAAAATAQVSASVQAVAKAAAAFDGAAYQSTQATLGAYPSDERGLSGAGASLSSTTGASAGATATAVAYVGGSIQARIAGAASGRAEVSQALRFFSSQDITAGISAMVQASLEFQTASAVSV
ncbi:MAG: hypothetical protein JRN42_08075, partial [Nitrososphaerota archaeon]|nr:hypothetical protein [Nitrososphaerota archaeon]